MINIKKKQKVDRSEIIAEAKREKGNCPHVENPKDPILLFGVGLDEVENSLMNITTIQK
jgi:hypothetical protein